MLRISKLTDYAVVVAVDLAQRSVTGAVTASAAQLAEHSGVPEPTVAKVLKQLARAELVQSQRGVLGGYRLARAARGISIAEVIEAIEGPIALTECCDVSGGMVCAHEGNCEVQPHWQRISAVVRDALAELSLADMARSPSQGEALVGLGRMAVREEAR